MLIRIYIWVKIKAIAAIIRLGKMARMTLIATKRVL